MKPLIVSIPHSGTRFLKERLGIGENVHTYQDWYFLIEKVTGRELIAPLRDPLSVWESWSKRYANFPYFTFAFHWYGMHVLDQLYDIDFICLEQKSDPRIKDWSSVGSEKLEYNNPGALQSPPADISALFALPFVKRHYNTKTRAAYVPKRI